MVDAHLYKLKYGRPNEIGCCDRARARMPMEIRRGRSRKQSGARESVCPSGRGVYASMIDGAALLDMQMRGLRGLRTRSLAAFTAAPGKRNVGSAWSTSLVASAPFSGQFARNLAYASLGGIKILFPRASCCVKRAPDRRISARALGIAYRTAGSRFSRPFAQLPKRASIV